MDSQPKIWDVDIAVTTTDTDIDASTCAPKNCLDLSWLEIISVCFSRGSNSQIVTELLPKYVLGLV